MVTKRPLFDLATLFSGGGLGESGFCKAGFRLRWACEIDPKARAVHRRHFPDAVMYSDVRKVNGRDVAPVDALLFGSPCQDLSIAGDRAGLAGGRSGLFFEAMRICDEMAALPAVAVWENVCGALSSDGGRDFGTVLREMARRWRGIAYRVLDLQFFGVPQRRRCVYVVGHTGGWERAAAILFEPDGLRWNPPARAAARRSVASPVTAGARKCDRGDGGDNLVSGSLVAFGISSDCLDRTGEGAGGTAKERSGLGIAEGVSPSLRAKRPNAVAFGGNNTSGPIEVAARLGCHESGSGYRLDFESDTLVAHSLRAAGFDASEDGTGRGTPLVPVALAENQRGEVREMDVVPALSTGGGKPGRGYPCVAFPANLSGTQCASSPDVSPVLGAKNPVAVSLRGRQGGGTAELSGEVAPAMRASQGGGDKLHTLQCDAVRRLTPVECERLMGVEDGYTAWGIDDAGRRVELADGSRYQILGNGIGENHGLWIGNRVWADLHECGRGEEVAA